MDVNKAQEGIMKDILKYLEQQQIIGGEDHSDPDYGLKRARSVLSDILRKIDNRAKLIDAFEAAMRAHNQYPLFDFGNIVPEFIIDDELYDKMTFRETLLVSSFSNDYESSVPTPVGGLCLDIQKAKGRGPLVRRDPKLEEELIEALTWKHEEGNVKDTGAWSEACKQCDEDKDSKSGPTIRSHQSKKCPRSESDDQVKESTKIQPTKSQLEMLEYELGIGDSLKRTQCKFLIHQSSQFYVKDMNAGSLLTSWVDKNFHTLEEKRTEFLVEKDGTVKQKTLFVALQKGKYYIKTQSTVNDTIERKFYSFKKTKNYISEGANYVLMRYLVLTNFVGNFELSTMYINGHMCRNIYKCTGPEQGIINNKRTKVCKIYRTIIEECGLTHNSITVLLLNGQIIKQEWESCDYILQLNPFAEVKEDKPRKLERIYLKHVWENDMELFSKYLDKKETHHLKLQQYLKDHAELKNIISDYLGRILLMKPKKVIEFTVDYFKQYAPITIPQDEYFAGEEQEESVRYQESEESSALIMPEEEEEEEEKDEKAQAIQYLLSTSDVCVREGVYICREESLEEESTSCICEDVCECLPEEETSEVKEKEVDEEKHVVSEVDDKTETETEEDTNTIQTTITTDL